ncbi:MAG: hypothetical protein IAG10_26630, partial [Planctomycetaceae bacterium]|nr:hypothetical protein [Planctomycetaceae bacterium]
MSLTRWNWLNTLRRRLNADFSRAPRPSKFTRRQSLYHRAGPVEALEDRWVLTVMVMGGAVGEAVGTLTFSIIGDGMNTESLTFNFGTVNGTAVSGSGSSGDFSAVSGSITIAPGDITSYPVPVTINNDTESESEESFTLELTDPITNAFVVGGTGTIQDDDSTSGSGSGSGGGGGTPEASISDSGAMEGSGPASFTISLSFSVTSTITVSYAASIETGDTASASDYGPSATSGTVTFNPGETSKTIDVPIVDDGLVESPETFTVSLSGASGATISTTNGKAKGTISDNEPVASISDGSGSEWTSGFGSGSGSGAGNASLEITLNQASAFTVTVNYSASINAIAPNVDTASTADYGPTGTSGTVTFAPGETTKTILIPIVDDAIVESSETFTVTLTGATAASISSTSGKAKGTINDNEPEVTIADGSGTEGFAARPAKFTVFLDHSVANAVIVNYTATTESTTDDTATSGTDYDGAGGSITIPAGGISAEIVITLPNDASPEDTETFTVTLTSATSASLAIDDNAQGTIIDNDAVRDGAGSGAGFAVDDPEVIEGDSGTTQLVFTVTLSMSSLDTVTVDYATDVGIPPDAASPGTDYTPTSGTLTFAPGETQKTVTVNVTPDMTLEGHETLFLNVSNPVEAFLDDPQGEGLILNDDGAYVWFNDSEVNEDSGSVTIPLTIDRTISSPVTVSYSTIAMTAQSTGTNSDYQATSGTVTFQPGGPQAIDISVSINGDSIIEDNETFNVLLTPPSNASIAAN